ncbi:anti-sigma factor [uncultured Tateyamaria sp.]|uniref:anti-sigma factor n=1 Tax=uncultured Tateyamaria sp. TaxID=455651 RepID=UPI00261DCDD6|nr:anti-sigma factor [uncultured Tateyamaria sp.]
MTRTPTYDENEVLAAEYVVGLLSTDERRAVETRARTDQALTAQIRAWEVYLSGLNEEYGFAQPSGQVKKAIDQRLFETPRPRQHWWARAGLVATVLALALIIGSISLDTRDATRMIAQLDSGESAYRFVVEVGEATETIDVSLTAGDPAADGVFELWLLLEGGAPQSLGTFAQSARLQSSAAWQVQEGMVLAVSLEPVGGSPTGTPTGPVLAVGALNDE